MVVIGAILFFLGTIQTFTTANPLNTTEIIIEKHIEPKFADKLTQYGLPGNLPFISNFMGHGTNVFFKPQIMLSNAFAPGQKVIYTNDRDCKELPMAPAFPFAATPELVSDEPVKIIETIVLGAEIPTVDKIVFIKPSSPIKPEISVPPMFISQLPIITEELVEVPVSTPIVSPNLPPLPVIPEPIKDVFQNAAIEAAKPDFIPEAPELPPLSVPEVLVPSFPTEPVFEPVSFVESIDNAVSVHIPEAPELIPYSPPKLPLPVVTEFSIECDNQNKTQFLGEAPIFIESQLMLIENLDPLNIPPPPALPSAEILVPQPLIEEKPMNIPLAPVLTEFQEPILMDTPVAEVIVSHREEVKPLLPITIPNPTELALMPVPDLPINLGIPEPIPKVPEQFLLIESKPMLVEDKFEAIKIPAPPVVPPVSLPVSVLVTEPIGAALELPEVVSNEITIAEVPEYLKPIQFPEAPSLAISEDISIQKETMNIPDAPELPPLPFPYTPIIMEKPMTALYPQAELSPMLIEEPKIPQVLGYKPLFMTFAEPAKLPLSEIESIISFPTSCVQSIVVERVLPNIVKEGKFEVFSSSNYPVLSSRTPTIGIRLF